MSRGARQTSSLPATPAGQRDVRPHSARRDTYCWKPSSPSWPPSSHSTSSSSSFGRYLLHLLGGLCSSR
eukprot:15118425-Heterocapsa_arctica.AAC.1